MTCKHLTILSGNNQPIIWGCKLQCHHADERCKEDRTKSCYDYEPQPDLYEGNKWLVNSKQDLDKIKLSWKVIKKVIWEVAEESNAHDFEIALNIVKDELLKRVERKAGK